MKVVVYDLKGQEAGHIDLGQAFSMPVRTDIIIRAVIAEQASARQPYGVNPLAGKRTSAHYHGLRRYRWSMMNKEMARMSRIHHQGYLDYTARFVPQAIKGRPAHPPKVEKVWAKKMNKKEILFAILAGAAATMDAKAVAKRGHIINGSKLPIVVKDDIEKISKTSEILAFLEKIGLGSEIERCKCANKRAGRGKSRGRSTKAKVGPLIVVKSDKGIGKIKAIDVSTVNRLMVSQLASGGLPGRLCIWSTSAAEEMKKLYSKLRG